MLNRLCIALLLAVLAPSPAQNCSDLSSQPESPNEKFMRTVTTLSMSVFPQSNILAVSLEEQLEKNGFQVLARGKYPMMIITLDAAPPEEGFTHDLELSIVDQRRGKAGPELWTPYKTHLGVRGRVDQAYNIAVSDIVFEFLHDHARVTGQDVTREPDLGEYIMNPVHQNYDGPFAGDWKAQYICPGGEDSSSWKIGQSSSGMLRIQEVVNRGLRVYYTGVAHGNDVALNTEMPLHYSVKLHLSADHNHITGTFSGHPNQCSTLSLERTF